VISEENNVFDVIDMLEVVLKNQRYSGYDLEETVGKRVEQKYGL